MPATATECEYDAVSHFDFRSLLATLDEKAELIELFSADYKDDILRTIIPKVW